MPKKDIIRTAQILGKTLREGPRVPQLSDWGDLVKELKKLKVSPGEVYRIVAEKKADEESNIRFNWKMIRFTFFVWERVKEDKGLCLKPKIDTIRAVVSDRRFKQFFYGYFPDLEFNPEKEVKLLNKLVAEKSQKPFFIEGYYKYEGSNRPIPQKHLDHILWGKNKE